MSRRFPCCGPGRPAAVAKSSQPVFRVVADARSDIGELALQPGLEGRDPVIGEQAQEAEDLDGALRAEPVAAEHGKQLGVADGVAVGVARQQDDQCPVDVACHPSCPAPGFPGGTGGLPGPDEGGVSEVGVPAAGEAGVIT